jgi:hypothetical protein
LTGAPRLAAATLMVQTPVAGFNCPSRRPNKLYKVGTWDARQRKPNYTNTHDKAARCDYASNGGDVYADASAGPSPLTYYGGDDPNQVGGPAGEAAFNVIAGKVTGVFYPGSYVNEAEIKDGLSNTLYAGEKYINTDMYENAENGGDNESMYIGDNADITRWSFSVPQQDRPGFNTDRIFGAAHASGFNAVLCDGSVRNISYTVDAEVFRRLGNRRDGQVVDFSKL